MTIDTAREYLLDMLDLTVLYAAADMVPTADYSEDTGFAVTISFPMPEEALASFDDMTDAEVYSVFAGRVFAGMRQTIADVVRIDAVPGDDPEHPSVYRLSARPADAAQSPEIDGEWRFTHAVTDGGSTILYGTVIEYIVVGDGMLTVCSAKGRPDAGFFLTGSGGAYDISGDAYVSAETATRDGAEVLIITDIAGDRYFYARER